MSRLGVGIGFANGNGARVVIPIYEYFDTTAIGQLPANWDSYATSPTTILVADAVANSLTTTTSPNVLKISMNVGGADRNVRAWPLTLQAADVGVQADVMNFTGDTYSGVTVAGNVGVFARGSNLKTNAPTCYLAGCQKNLQAFNISKVVAGTITSLASVTSIPFQSSGTRHRILFSCVGGLLKMQVYVLAGSQSGKYLQADGTWSTTPAYALQVTDYSITASGYAGVAKNNSYLVSDYFDNVIILPGGGDGSVPTVSLTAPTDGASLSGSATLTATASDIVGITKVEFLVDGGVRGAVYNSPYTMDLNTVSLSNGTHSIAARAYDTQGNYNTTSAISVTVSNNTAVNRPTITQNLAQTRLNLLAYTGTSFDASDDAVIPSVDVTVCATNQVAHIRSLNANIHCLLYSNISNLYLGLECAWMKYATTVPTDPEDGYYHVSAATAFTRSGASTVAAKKFWSVFYQTGASSYTGSSSAFAADAATFPNTTTRVVMIGQHAKFREVNVTLTTVASGGWTAALEYCNGVDGSGVANSWATLTTLTETTSGLTSSGQITFTPPSDWVMATFTGMVSVNGFENTPMYFLRWRCTATGTAPIASEICGKDYTGGAYTNAGTIPAFDSTADADNDGYLNETEWANANQATKTARFKWQSRVFSTYGVGRYQTRPTDTHFATWAASYHDALMTANPDYNGVFMDNTTLSYPSALTTPSEPTASYGSEIAGLLNSIWRGLSDHASMGNRWVLPNLGGVPESTTTDTFLSLVPAAFYEFQARVMTDTWSAVATTISLFTRDAADASPIPILSLDTYTTNNALTADEGASRWQLAAQAYYLLLYQTDMWLTNWGGEDPAGHWQYRYWGALAHDFGAPSGSYTTWATGTDPENGARTYKVYRRDFANGFVLYKPLSVSGGTTGDATATTHDLGGTHTPLNADGSDGTPTPTVTLRNGEAALFRV